MSDLGIFNKAVIAFHDQLGLSPSTDRSFPLNQGKEERWSVAPSLPPLQRPATHEFKSRRFQRLLTYERNARQPVRGIDLEPRPTVRVFGCDGDFNSIADGNYMPSRRPLLIRPWSPEDDAKLLALLRRGSHTTIIAARLRRTPSAVRTRKSQLADIAKQRADACPECRSNETYGWGVRRRDQQEFPNRGCAACGCLWNGVGTLKTR